MRCNYLEFAPLLMQETLAVMALTSILQYTAMLWEAKNARVLENRNQLITMCSFAKWDIFALDGLCPGEISTIIANFAIVTLEDFE